MVGKNRRGKAVQGSARQGRVGPVWLAGRARQGKAGRAVQVDQACRVNQAGRAEEDMMARQAGQCRVGT